jgi:hypothetical protein
MKDFFRKYGLLLAPVIVLFITLFFLNYAVQHFKDTSHSFVYDTNKESVLRFSRELAELTEKGYNSTDHGDLYTSMIEIYNTTLGEKYGIVTFLTDDAGQIQHSSETNQSYLTPVLADANNMSLIKNAAESKSDGEIELKHNGAKETYYYHWFYSGDLDYCLFMTVDRQVIEAQLEINGVLIPIAIVGFLLFVLLEYMIWQKKTGEAAAIAVNDTASKEKDDDAD